MKDGRGPWMLGAGTGLRPMCPRWAGPGWGQQVEGTAGGRWILLVLGLAGPLPGGSEGPAWTDGWNVGEYVTASPKAGL